jgi:NADPH-dependent curcumin reductase CurA
MKAKLLIDHFGFDHVINYKTTKDINQSVKEACPDGVDVYYDNVAKFQMQSLVLLIFMLELHYVVR